MKYIRSAILIMCVLLSSCYCYAQIEFSTGFEASYPQLLNSNNTKVNYGQISFGVRGGIAWKPEETQFFPILDVSYGRTRLPLQQFGKNVAALNFNYLNVMLNENYIVTFPKSQLFIYGGVGFSALFNKGITVGGSGGETMQATIDSTKEITKVFPAINIGFEYNYGESTGKDLYLTMGINFQYILLLQGNNVYDIHVAAPNYTTYPFQTSLSGNLIVPQFYIAIHYKLHLIRDSHYL